jgi:hypothetical protein
VSDAMLPKEIEDMIDPEKMREVIARNLRLSGRLRIRENDK